MPGTKPDGRQGFYEQHLVSASIVLALGFLVFFYRPALQAMQRFGFTGCAGFH